jgi:hypothetical protein
LERDRTDDPGILGGGVAVRIRAAIREENFGEPAIGEIADRGCVVQIVANE